MVDVGIGPAGDVWVTNNWQVYQDAMGKVDEALQTQGAGQGVVVFYGMAKPVKTPFDRAGKAVLEHTPHNPPSDSCREIAKSFVIATAVLNAQLLCLVGIIDIRKVIGRQRLCRLV